jgi:magnesium-transporting ATPase (P-type)
MLWVASLIALVAGMPTLSVAILAVILINAVFSFAQEWKAERQALALEQLLPQRAVVRRDGLRRVIDAALLVPGDIVELQSGDRISADIELLEVHDLELDTSTFTGESLPSRPGSGDLAYAGTFVTSGAAVGIVRATGRATRLAEIAALVQRPRSTPTPLARELRRLVETIAVLAAGAGAVFFALSRLLGIPATVAFVFSLGATVALVPEGLLPTITLSMAVAAQRMAKKQALVRRLDAVESLGLTTVVCTDKTGTLTENKMAVVEVWTPEGCVKVQGKGYEPFGSLSGPQSAVELAKNIARAAARSSSGQAALTEKGWQAEGDPTEVALWVLANRAGVDLEADRSQNPLRRQFPFDPRRRRSSVIAGSELLVKGAPDSILPRCVGPPSAIERCRKFCDTRAADGFRVLAVASCRLDRDQPETMLQTDAADPDTIEVELELLGAVAMEDPARPEVRDSIERCRKAGISVIMVTGDHPATAAAVAQRTGLARPGAPLLVGSDLPEDLDAMASILDRDGAIVARVSPEQKLAIAQALQKRGHVVAMTGDGTNDAPVLHVADVGIAMGASGTDVARQASDIVLLDDNFSTIVSAIEQGRATFANIRKFLTYHLTDNVAELTPFAFWALSAGKIPLALSVLQILALDLGTDALPALALGVEQPGPEVMDGPPPRRGLVSAGVLLRAFGVLGPTEAIVEMLAFFSVLLTGGWVFGRSPSGALLASASGAAFAAVVVGQAANAFACRSSRRTAFQIGFGGNAALAVAVAAELVLMGALIGISPLAAILGHSVPSPAAIPWLAIAGPAVLGIDALYKRVSNRRRLSKSTGGDFALDNLQTNTLSRSETASASEQRGIHEA